MSDWYYAINGEQFGPVSNQELHDLAGAGSIQPTDVVWKEGYADWEPADAVAGLFPMGSATTVGPPQLPTDVEFEGDPATAQTFVGDSAAFTPGAEKTPDDLKIPLIVSGVFNAVVGIAWAFTCIGLVATIPMCILAYHEIQLFQKADKISLTEFAAETKALTIYQIVVGVFNTPTLICGIILMVQAGKYETSEQVAA